MSKQLSVFVALVLMTIAAPDCFAQELELRSLASRTGTDEAALWIYAAFALLGILFLVGMARSINPAPGVANLFLAVKIKLPNGDEAVEYLRELTMSGAEYVTDIPLEKGTIVSFCLESLPDFPGTRHVELFGRVVRCRRVSSDPLAFTVAVRFLERKTPPVELTQYLEHLRGHPRNLKYG